MTLSIKDLTIEEKIGQLFLIGIHGTELTDDAASLVNEIRPGGVCLFARNVSSREQVRALNDAISQAIRIDPILTLDEEGGLVDRLRRIMRPVPAASRSETPESTRKAADLIAETLRILGFNMDLAPVVDVIDDDRRAFSNGLASRTYGNSPIDVVDHAAAFIDALETHGISGCVKHFPGLGASTVDSHEELPVVEISDDELLSCDLLPYRRLLDRRRIAVMVGHAAYPNTRYHEVDANGRSLPATLNPKLLRGLLRDEMSYNGLIVTDDLEMGAIIRNYGMGEACVMSLQAGVDMLAICAEEKNIREGYSAVTNAIDDGRLSMAEIDRSVERVLAFKSDLATPSEFDNDRLEAICGEIEQLN